MSLLKTQFVIDGETNLEEKKSYRNDHDKSSTCTRRSNASRSTPENYNFSDFHLRDTIMPEKLFKVIIIGDPTVGKTAFVKRYVQNSYTREYKGTVGVDFALKIIKVSDTETIKLQLWDIAGQERFTWMTRVYYKDAHGCVIMFDLSNKNSFINSLKWKKDVDTKCTQSDGNPIPCMLLGNKCDLAQRQIDQLDIEAFYKENNFIGWTETSAKDGLMVNDSMQFLINSMMGQYNDETDQPELVKLSGPNPETKKSCSFC
ncbi:Small GTP-binding protein domain,P-loop containing nucleoside triphosphate hydrolase,Small GTPase [Cinara cedri]|uniref:Ras-related protein Rab n=1 Tax=Cinara cedri TaxID=506608 RepID=A0A5E4NJX5_9HEMI|nr:Small GTP-binding protein domain,P-loop containing nucleoside triphosphate hydrolase,Small GTPase [Cinara cedri]